MDFSVVVERGGYFVVCVCLIAVTSLVSDHGLKGMWASIVVAHGLNICGS